MAKSYNTFLGSQGDHTQEQATPDEDSALLLKLGYRQVLKRNLSPFANFATSFSIISVITGIFQLYSYGIATGGPVSLIWGWIIVGSFTMTVGLSMAEICSAYPTSGGMYYCAAALAPKGYGPIASWYTGWFNLLGELSNIAAINHGAASFISSLVVLHSGVTLTPPFKLLIFTTTLVAQTICNIFGNRFIEYLATVSVIWHIGGVITIIIVLIAVPATWQSPQFLFLTFINESGWESKPYVFLLGLLVSQWTLGGYDASAHMTEETVGASTAGPKGILYALGISTINGFLLLLAMTISIQDISSVLQPKLGNSVTQLFVDACGVPVGMRPGESVATKNFSRSPKSIGISSTIESVSGTFVIVVSLGAMFFCGVSMITTTARTIFAFSRDGALPYSTFFHKINLITGTPFNGLMLAVCVAFWFGLPSLGSRTAQEAVTSIATIGLYLSYGIPIFLRFYKGKEFQQGDWNLGRFSPFINFVAVIWIAFITILFVLPPLYPITLESFNYASVTVGGTFLLTSIGWLVSARFWFKGPILPDHTAD